MDRDNEHLRLLSIFHYVVAGLAGLLSLLPVIHITIGILMIRGELDEKATQGDPAHPELFGWAFIVLGSLILVVGLSIATCIALAGRNLARRRRYTFCLVTAALACLFSPFGTVLGIFTILVLMRDSVRGQFGLATFAPAPTA